MDEVTAVEAGVDGTLADLLDVIGRTTDAMIAIDGERRIIAWNRAATGLLGYEPEDALGRSCEEVLCWSDRHGEGLCDGFCPAVQPGAEGELIETREVLGRSASGRRLWLNASTIVPPTDMQEQCRLVHLVREVALPPELERLVAERISGVDPGPGLPDPLDVLTPREREVLQLLTEGLDGSAVAERLFVSPATVRNHVQHILTKLGVHSRVEAVALALRGR